MNSVVGSSVPSDVATPRATTREVSLFRLYTLRVAYLIMAAGLGAFIWPNVIHHTNEFAAAHGYPGRLARGPRLDRRIGPSIPAENVTDLTVRTDLEGDLFDGLCAAVMVRPRNQRRHGRRHQSCADGCYSYSSHPMALCLRALRPEAW